MTWTCAWCGKVEKYSGHKDPSKDYICGSCVQLLLKFTQDELKQAYRLAISKGNSGKAAVLKMFIQHERIQDNEKRPQRFERLNDRGGTFRIPRNKKSGAEAVQA